jgi:hypothetical protein
MDLCERLPTDVLIYIGEFINVKTMEYRIRLTKLSEKLKQFNTRTSQEWINIAVNFPLHFKLRHVKVCRKNIKVINNVAIRYYRKQDFVHYCYITAKEKYKMLYIHIINHNLVIVTPKYQGQQHTTLDGKNAIALPKKLWIERNYGEQGCAPLLWYWSYNDPTALFKN